MDPGQSATVLVALAWMGGTPVNMSAGRVMNVPPPATELSMPPSTAAIKRMHICKIVMGKYLLVPLWPLRSVLPMIISQQRANSRPGLLHAGSLVDHLLVFDNPT